jgi:hypothetical protein
MHRLILCMLATLSTLIFISQAEAQIHPKEVLGRRIFDSFRLNKFSDFYLRSIFSLEEDQFRELLFGIKNHELRQNLLHFYTLDYPPSARTELAKWRVAFAYTWRDQWRHIALHSPRMVQRDAFDPILQEAKEFGVQWETTRLLAIEVLLDAQWKDNRFEVKRDTMIDHNATHPTTLFFDRKLSYRIKLDKSTHGNAFMIGYAPEDSEKLYNQNILGNGSGQADIVFRFNTPFPDQLHYFCPDESGAGGAIKICDADQENKPNQRTDILLTFSYGQPEKAYQILVKEVLSTPWGEVFCERPEWIGEVPLPRGLSFSN